MYGTMQRTRRSKEGATARCDIQYHDVAGTTAQAATQVTRKFRCIARKCGEREEGVYEPYVDEAFDEMTTLGAKIPRHT